MAALREAVRHGWRPEQEFDVVHLLTTQVVQEFGPRFLRVVPTVTTMHHVHDEAEVPVDTSGDAIMTVCSRWEEEMIQRGIPREKLVRVANGVDVGRFHPPSAAQRQVAREKLGIQPREMAVGFVGKKGSDNFGRKGFDLFCAGLKALSDQGISCVAVVLGSGWQADMKKYLPSQLRRVHRPFAENPSEVYQAMDVYWVCSRIEGGPVPLLEAMACGIPCIARPVGMVEDVVEDGVSGYIARSGQPEEFAERTVALMRDPKKREAVFRAARARIESNFDWKLTVSSAPRLYRKAWENFTGPKRAPLNWEGESRPGATSSLDSVKTMAQIPQKIRRSCLFQEDLNMVHELFRVRNRTNGSFTALRLMRKYPEKSPELLGLLFNAWFGGVRMTLGRWKSQILGRNKKSE